MIDILEKEPFTLSDMQRFHLALDAAKGFDTDFIKNVAYMTAEVGEVLNAYRQISRVTSQPEQEKLRAHVAEELADCLAYVVKLANYAEIDLETAYIEKMHRNISRSWTGTDLNRRDV